MKMLAVLIVVAVIGCSGSNSTGSEFSFKKYESDDIKNGNSYVIPNEGFSIGGIEYTNGDYWDELPQCVDVATGSDSIYIIDNCDVIKSGSEIRIILR